jgi:dinuclear metal center YbgI/SA1388 family protein
MNVTAFKDYCPNGLQVEGKPHISRLAVAVTSSQRAIDAAAAWGADALLVHHGLFWKSDDPSLKGPLGNRVRSCIKADLNLFAYHLPLDCHPGWGNNRSLGAQLGFEACRALDSTQLIWGTTLKKAIDVPKLESLLHDKLGRAPLLVGGLNRRIKTIAWCTGGAQNYLDKAISMGVDAYISGEISEQTTHLARETGVVFAAAGHHATERYGVQALAVHLAARFKLETLFFDDDNPA